MKRILVLFLLFFACLNVFSHDSKKFLDYTENGGQWNPNVLFRSSLPNGSVYLENDGFTFSMLDGEEFSKLHDLQFASEEEQNAFSVPGHAWKINFLGSLPSETKPDKKTSYYSNYFIGDDEDKWASHLNSYQMIDYVGFYENINLKVYSQNMNFKYDFIVEPGADPSVIKFNYDGLERTEIIDGNLVLQTSIGEFIENEPYAYQLIYGKLTPVECNYILINDHYSFEFPNGYDSNHKLIIDPELIASTLSGTVNNQNFGHSAAYDLAGNIYTGCVASGTGYPASVGAFSQAYGGGFWDVGISKLSPDGSDLLWATYLGGSNADYPHSIVANSNQELYVYGSTNSNNYPTTNNSFQPNNAGGVDILFTHLSADGSALIGSTYLGGTAADGRNATDINYGDQYRGEVFLDFNENPVIGSASSSNNFPTLPNAYQPNKGGNQDAVLVKMNPNLSTLLVSTFYGGPGNEMAYGIRAKADGTMIIAGSAEDGLNITPGAYQTQHLGDDEAWFGNELDGFIAQFNNDGSALVSSTYHGTTSQDQIFFLDLDAEENIYVFGQGGTDCLLLMMFMSIQTQDSSSPNLVLT